MLKVAGNFSQIGLATNHTDYQYNYSNNQYSFYASGSHKVVLNGNTQQTISFDYPAVHGSHFHDIEINNTYKGITNEIDD